MRNRKEVYRQRHRINPRNTYAKIPKKPKEIPEVSDYEEEYEDPNDSQPTLSKFLKGIGMGKQPEDEAVGMKKMLDRVIQETQLAREMEQRVVLGLVTKVVDVMENGTEEDEEKLLEELKDFLNAVNGTYHTKN